MAEVSLLISCDCGYRDVREGVKAHQKTCGVKITSAHRHTIVVQECGESSEPCAAFRPEVTKIHVAQPV